MRCGPLHIFLAALLALVAGGATLFAFHMHLPRDLQERRAAGERPLLTGSAGGMVVASRPVRPPAPAKRHRRSKKRVPFERAPNTSPPRPGTPPAPPSPGTPPAPRLPPLTDGVVEEMESIIRGIEKVAREGGENAGDRASGGGVGEEGQEEKDGQPIPMRYEEVDVSGAGGGGSKEAGGNTWVEMKGPSQGKPLVTRRAARRPSPGRKKAAGKGAAALTADRLRAELAAQALQPPPVAMAAPAPPGEPRSGAGEARQGSPPGSPPTREGPFWDAARRYERKHLKHMGPKAEALRREGKPSFGHYVVWSPRSGTGNRVLGIVAAALLALATDRTLVIDLRSSHVERMSLPDLFGAPLSGFLMTDAIHADYTGAQWGQDKVQLNLEYWGTQCPQIRQEGIRDCCAAFGTVQCADMSGGGLNVRYLAVNSCQYWAPLLFANDVYRSTLDTWFRDADGEYRVWEKVASWIVRPAPQLQARIDSYMRTHGYGDNGSLTVCIQKRQGSPPFDDPERPGSVAQVANCVQQMTGPGGWLEGRDTKFHVSTMSAAVEDHFKQLLGASNVHTFEDANKRSEATGNREHDQSAVVDIWLLGAACNFSITSPHSTFGYIAPAMFGVPSFRLPPDDDMCRRAGLPGVARPIEPCSHFLYEPRWGDNKRCAQSDACPVGNYENSNTRPGRLKHPLPSVLVPDKATHC